MIGAAAAAGAASQLLSTLLSKLSSSYASSSSSSTTPALTTALQQAMPGDSKKPTASPVPKLSAQTLMALVSLQGQASASSASTDGTSDPLQQVFSAMDEDGDGEASKTEMESYVQKQGGTQAQADTFFNALSQGGSSSTGSSGISETQMADAASEARQGGHHRHHHQASGANGDADNVASSLLQAMDSDDDGDVSQNEFSNFITSNGGTATDASNDFAALNTRGSNALTSADFAKAYTAYQTQQTTQSSGSMVVSLMNAFAQADSTGSTSINA